jgi:hypothetical protein
MEAAVTKTMMMTTAAAAGRGERPGVRFAQGTAAADPTPAPSIQRVADQQQSIISYRLMIFSTTVLSAIPLLCQEHRAK